MDVVHRPGSGRTLRVRPVPYGDGNTLRVRPVPYGDGNYAP